MRTPLHSVRLALLAAAGFCGLAAGPVDPAAADGPGDRREPYIGYVYPAGGVRGSVFQATAGGQNLNGVAEAVVTGDGVRVTIVAHMRPLSAMQQQELRRRLQEIREARRAAANPAREKRGKGEKPKEEKKKPEAAAPGKDGKDAKKEGEFMVVLPDWPALRNLEEQSNDALEQIAARFLVGGQAKRQMNPQIAESVDVEIEIAPGAVAGPREFRFRTPAGLTNPMRFDVGAVRETSEEESFRGRPKDAAPVEAPIVINGQILPGDVDEFRVRARRGQRLLIEAHARDLIPYLADAVPGWFQATLAVLDPKGRELAWADDFRFDPDPRLVFRVPVDGDYVVEIRDALYRGREDFVYRLAITELPAETAETPGGGPGAPPPSPVAGPRVPQATDVIAICDEVEPNDTPDDAQGVVLPRIVRGRIGRPDDVDVFVFQGSAGEEFVAEVEGRRLRSPIDSVIRLTDPSGAVVAWNDDFAGGSTGLLTHHADSYLRAKLPSDGVYRLRLADAQAHGSADHTYRLRLSAPMPDYELVVSPASLSVAAGRAVPLHVHAVRKDGFDGEIAIDVADTASGFQTSGARIPAGRTTARITLTAPFVPTSGPVPLRIVGRAAIGGAPVVRAAVPAEDMMQAFFYRHLAPAQELLVAVTGQRRGGPIATRPDTATAKLPSGGTVRVMYRIPGLPQTTALRVALDEPPPGITVAGWEVAAGSLQILLAADAAVAKPGFSDNLIFEVSVDPTPEAAAKGARRYSAGWLPALPVDVVAGPGLAVPAPVPSQSPTR